MNFGKFNGIKNSLGNQRGATMTELLIALPMFVMLIFIIAELGLMYQAKSVLDMASLAAARAGAVSGGDPGKMRRAAIAAMAPVHAPGHGTFYGIAQSWLEANALHGVGATKVIPPPPPAAGPGVITVVPGGGASFNGAGGGLRQGLRVEILSPTSRMMKDFGVSRSYGEARARTAWQRMTGQPATVDGAYTARVIPNDNLMYRDTRLINNVNVQDANLLKIRVTYLYETKMPLTRYFFMPFMNANLTGVLFAGQARRFGGVAVGSDWRVPLVSYQTVRMQSDFKEASLSAAAPGSDGGTGNDWDGDGGHDDSNPLGLPQYEEEPGGEISPPDSGYITVSLGHGATNKNLGPVTIVTEEDRGVVTRKTVKIVDGKIIIDGVQATGYDGAVAVPAHIDQRLGGNSAKYGPNPLDDPYVLALVAYSPALQENLKTLIEGNGWNVRYTNGNSYVDYANKIIYIRKGPNEVGVLKALSHEVGHALRRPAVSRLADFPVATQNAALAARNAYLRAVPGSAAEEEAMGDYLKAIRDAAVQKYLESEGDAVLKNIQVQQEILSNGGPNIGVDCGFSGSCQDRYRTIYEQYLVDNNADAARTAIAELRKDEEAAGTTETYKENFGRQWNESHKLVWETDLRQQKYP